MIKRFRQNARQNIDTVLAKSITGIDLKRRNAPGFIVHRLSLLGKILIRRARLMTAALEYSVPPSVGETI